MKSLRQMIDNIKDPKLKRELIDVADGVIVGQVRCLSEDTFKDVEEPIKNKDGKFVKDKNGKIKTKTVTKIDRVGCKGRIISKIYNNGNIPGLKDEDGKGYLRASRQRLDGHLGFECWCGNDSRLSKQEKGVVKQVKPSKEDLQEVFKRINENPTIAKVSGEVDGFLIEELR